MKTKQEPCQGKYLPIHYPANKWQAYRIDHNGNCPYNNEVMNTSPFPTGFSANLILSADRRFVPSDYGNDQIWELVLHGGDPRALTLQTTFGLRALWMSLFPRFLKGDLDLIDPAEFHRPPQIMAAYPNCVSLTFEPFQNLSVTLDCWVPSSQVIAARLLFENTGQEPQDFTFELIGSLQPFEPGERMAVAASNLTNILQGRTEEISPVCFMTGGPFPGRGPFAGLAQNLSLPSNQQRAITWALAATPDEAQSLRLAKQTTACAWDEEMARIQQTNLAQILQISTGDPQWDACFALAQRTAYSLFLPASQHLPHPSFVLSRRPDHGHSLRGDGSDYPHLWNGQTALEAYYLNTLILPGGVRLAEGVLRNFLHVQEENGEIDWKPGLAGQRSHILAQPLLAALAWQIYQVNHDDNWLQEVFPPLLKFLKTWFNPEHDRDQDGMPEWGHPLQTGFPSAPMYDRWQPEGQGVEIAYLECPSLAAFLYNECQCLQRMALRIQVSDDLAWLQERSQILVQALNSMWNARSKTYRYRDFATETANKGDVLRTIKGRGRMTIGRSFKTPQRLQIQLALANNDTRPLKIVIIGEGPQGQIEEIISFGQLHWRGGTASCTSRNVYLRLQEVDIQGISPEDRGTIATVDYTQEDLSLFTPLWAAIPSAEQTKTLLEKNLLPRYLKKFGLAATPQITKNKEDWWRSGVHLPWNHLMGEALLELGYHKQATDLLKRIMKAQVEMLNRQHRFQETCHAESGESSGEYDILTGLPPLGLFLKVAGIQHLSSNRIVVAGPNPFPKPVSIRFQTMQITRYKKDTIIQLDCGETITLHGPGPHHVYIEPIQQPGLTNS
jgi:hypothetical protein